MITARDADFQSSGLRDESLIRLGFPVVIPRNQIAGSNWIDFIRTAQPTSGKIKQVFAAIDTRQEKPALTQRFEGS